MLHVFNSRITPVTNMRGLLYCTIQRRQKTSLSCPQGRCVLCCFCLFHYETSLSNLFGVMLMPRAGVMFLISPISCMYNLQLTRGRAAVNNKTCVKTALLCSPSWIFGDAAVLLQPVGWLHSYDWRSQIHVFKWKKWEGGNGEKVRFPAVVFPSLIFPTM